MRRRVFQGWTARQIAALYGISESAVRRAKREGKVFVLSDGTIEPASAQAYWGAKYAPKEEALKELLRDDEELPEDSQAMAEMRARARVQYEVYRAKHAQLEYEMRMGRLVPRDEVMQALIRVFDYLREQLVALPDAIADQMVELGVEAERLRQVFAAAVEEVMSQCLQRARDALKTK